MESLCQAPPPCMVGGAVVVAQLRYPWRARSPLGERLSMYWREMGLHRSSILQRIDIYL